jgi:hypothetical protein
MRHGSISALLILILAIQGVALQANTPQSKATPKESVNPIGRWRVKFTMAGLEKNLILVSRTGGVASFFLLDTGPDDKAVPGPQPAAWSQLTNGRVSFSGEAELPLGTCCRELGTLIFKGKFSSANSLAGKVIFITSVDEEENPNKFRSLVGTFTATRVTD